jgi:hypothetical protein
LGVFNGYRWIYQQDAYSDGFAGRGLRIESLDVAGEQHGIQEQVVDVADENGLAADLVDLNLRAFASFQPR